MRRVCHTQGVCRWLLLGICLVSSIYVTRAQEGTGEMEDGEEEGEEEATGSQVCPHPHPYAGNHPTFQ